MSEEEEGQYTKPFILEPLKVEEMTLLWSIATYAL